MREGELEEFLEHVGQVDFKSWLGTYDPNPEAAFVDAVDEAHAHPQRPSSRFVLEHREALRRWVSDLAAQDRLDHDTDTPRSRRARAALADSEDTPPTTFARDYSYGAPVDPRAFDDELATVVEPFGDFQSARHRMVGEDDHDDPSTAPSEDPHTAASLVPDDTAPPGARGMGTWVDEHGAPLVAPPVALTPTPIAPVRTNPNSAPSPRRGLSVGTAAALAAGTFVLGIGVGAVTAALALSASRAPSLVELAPTADVSGRWSANAGGDVLVVDLSTNSAGITARVSLDGSASSRSWMLRGDVVGTTVELSDGEARLEGTLSATGKLSGTFEPGPGEPPRVFVATREG